MEKENQGLHDEVKFIYSELDYMKDRFEHLEQEKRINDIVVDNVDTSEMNDPNKHLQELINKTLMGVIVSDNELINTTVIKKTRLR